MAENEIFICFRGLLKEGARLSLIQAFSQTDVPFVKIKEQLGSVIRLLCNYLRSAVVGLLAGSKSSQVYSSPLRTSCGKGRASGTVGQLRRVYLAQMDFRHQSTCSPCNADADRCCWEASCALGSQPLQQFAQRPSIPLPPLPQGSPVVTATWAPVHAASPQMDSDAEPEKVRALFVVMPAPQIFIVDFIVTVIFFFFFFLLLLAALSVREKRFRHI